MAPVFRVSRGHFPPAQFANVERLIAAAAEPLIPAIQRFDGLIYYHVGLDRETSTVVNVSVWRDLDAARQMDSLAEMRDQRAALVAAGVAFDPVANYEPTWTIGSLTRGP